MGDFVFGERLGVYMRQYGQIVSVTREDELGEGRFELMLDCDAFDSIPNSLEIGGRNYPVESVTRWVTSPLLSRKESS